MNRGLFPIYCTWSDRKYLLLCCWLLVAGCLALHPTSTSSSILLALPCLDRTRNRTAALIVRTSRQRLSAHRPTHEPFSSQRLLDDDDDVATRLDPEALSPGSSSGRLVVVRLQPTLTLPFLSRVLRASISCCDPALRAPRRVETRRDKTRGLCISSKRHTEKEVDFGTFCQVESNPPFSLSRSSRLPLIHRPLPTVHRQSTQSTAHSPRLSHTARPRIEPRCLDPPDTHHPPASLCCPVTARG
ncbi:hypothetical protein BD289DRAFT_88744 [Coniella lustricola]|uniref:Uncharacterized protein n=1 Tax=Coniella lustricola TaxID=2025994 RepID=A0A2T2ZYJ0_9PEZI|nr:hypothetical protein BD289DRAFT_88744 [Coniella lustricola]